VVIGTDASGRGEVGVLLNNTPFCTTPPVITLSITPTSLWPPNGKIVPVTVSGKIRDTGCAIKTADYAVRDEYGKVQPQGAVALGPEGTYSFTVLLQASRLGTDKDGRRYMVTVRAKDRAGNSGSKTGEVNVPHAQSH
jgi:endo-1,4-beta-xylanase